MRIITEERLFNFDFWGGAVFTASLLEEDDFDSVEVELEDIYPDGISDIEINDIFWFETDFIANICGYENFEEMMEDRT